MTKKPKVLFVSSGNKNGQAVPIILNQAESLTSEGLVVDFYLIQGKGYWGYLKNLSSLKKKIHSFNPDVIHAHGLASLVTPFLFNSKLVVSLLGSELNENSALKFIIKILSRFYWKNIIVKSEDMFQKLGVKNRKKVSIIPNGVDFNKMKLISKKKAREYLNWDLNEKIILFLADPTRTSKNFKTAKEAFSIIENDKIKLRTVYNVPNEDVFWYLNATDVLLSTSLWEGSPNVIKEAMACNCPVVATNVGDIKWLFGEEKGHFLCTHNPKNIAENIIEAFEFVQSVDRTKGRFQIERLKLDSKTVANRIIEMYYKC